MIRRLGAVFLLLMSGLAWGQSTDLVLTHATIHPVNGPVIVDGTLVVRNGKIVSVGHGGGTGIDLHGQHLYPSLMDPDTSLGLVEISEVRATRDDTETGAVNANLRADIAFNPDSQLLPVAMSSGILVAGVAPRGGLISGRGSVMMLSGWTREDMTVAGPAALFANWPSLGIDRRPDAKPEVKEQEQTRRENVRKFEEAFADATAYQRGARIEQDIQWEAMAPFVKGELPVVVGAERQDEIEAALDWAAKARVRLVIVGGMDAALCADKLAKAHVGVIFTHETDIPTRDYEGYDLFFRTPEKLVQAGVPVALSSGGGGARVRDLRDLAARTTGHGLTEDQALRCITLTPAELLGVQHRLGSLEPGKDGTFFVADGDILSPGTHVLRAWIMGREIDLSKDRQKQLYDKYRNRP